ncbi:MAG: L-seryl-tRNA(Sec) selenium transferase [Actinobacteria bacterium]|nr:L-seryl-tRNA(Sec) selenium transferase [Actinomycetota bacterium]
MGKSENLRSLPKVDAVLEAPVVQELTGRYPRDLVVDGVRSVIDAWRREILEDGDASGGRDLSIEKLARDLQGWLEAKFEPSLKKVINATGVVIHTNLGRSLLSASAIKAAVLAASSYSNLEFNLETGERGSRHSHIERILCELTGAEAAMAVNNNAAAVLLALSAMAAGKEAIVSRGELVEIGGSFRVPDVMRQSGAVLKEIGTTNKTYASDYRVAVTEETALLMKVHPSNFRIVGFTHEAALAELVELGREISIPVMQDLGSGVLVDLRRFGLPYEPTVQESIEAGVDIVTFSGDKLLGGPQAGIIVGRKEYIDKMKKHPLARAIRLDKMTIAALETTLKEYLDLEKVVTTNPTLRMITEDKASVKRRADRLAKRIAGVAGGLADISVDREVARVGGGSLPLAEIPTAVVVVRPRISCAALEAGLLAGGSPVVVRVKDDALLIDPRTIQPDEEKELVEAFRIALSGGDA